jgi:hypothetical protein
MVLLQPNHHFDDFRRELLSLKRHRRIPREKGTSIHFPGDLYHRAEKLSIWVSSFTERAIGNRPIVVAIEGLGAERDVVF